MEGPPRSVIPHHHDNEEEEEPTVSFEVESPLHHLHNDDDASGLNPVRRNKTGFSPVSTVQRSNSKEGGDGGGGALVGVVDVPSSSSSRPTLRRSNSYRRTAAEATAEASLYGGIVIFSAPDGEEDDDEASVSLYTRGQMIVCFMCLLVGGFLLGIAIGLACGIILYHP